MSRSTSILCGSKILSLGWLVISRGLDRYLNTPFGRKHKFNECVGNSPTIPEIRAPDNRQRRTSVFPDSFTASPLHLANRAKDVAVGNGLQPSLETIDNFLRQQELPEAYPVKALSSKRGMTYISRQSYTTPAVDDVLNETLPVSKKMTTLQRHSPMSREPDGALQ